MFVSLVNPTVLCVLVPESSVTRTSQSLHAHYLTKINKGKFTTNRVDRGLIKREYTDNCNNANPPTIFLNTVFIWKGIWHIQSYTLQIYGITLHRKRRVMMGAKSWLLEFSLNDCDYQNEKRRGLQKRTHSQQQQQLIISKMFSRERKIYNCRKMIISTRYNKCYLL